jgi:ATP-binding cassette, subfamily B (MDR/TAP), member 1
MFNHYLSQDMEFFDKPENSAGSLVSKLSTYPTNMQELLGFNIELVIIIIVNLLSSCILSIATGWKLGLTIVFGALPLVVFAGYLRIRLEFKLDDDTFQRFADSASLAAEAVGAIRTVASFTLEQHILDKYQNSLKNIERKSVKSLLWIMLWYSFTQSINFLAMALGFW